MLPKVREYSADVAIIGSGIAGYSAALTAVNAGKSTLLLHQGPGGTALTSGLFDGFQLASIDQYQPDLKAASKRATGDIYNSLQALVKQTESPVLLADIWGRAYQVYSAQVTQFAGDLAPFLQTTRSATTQHRDTRVQGADPLIGIIQFGYHRVSPDPASHFNRSFGQFNLFVDLPLELPETQHKGPESPFFLASMLDQELASGVNTASVIHNWSAQINQFKRRYPSLQLVLFPPILGCERTPEIAKQLTAACHTPCAELLATTPSLPGYRLFQHLQKRLQDAGERLIIIEGTVKTEALTNQKSALVGSKSETKNATTTLDSCELLTPDGETIKLHAAQWLLATGGWTGGGLVKELGTPAHEQVFGLPLVSIGIDKVPKRLHEIPHPAHGKRSDPHVSQWLLHPGVMIDAQYRACSRYEVPLFENLRATGAVVATAQRHNLYETSMISMNAAFAALQAIEDQRAVGEISSSEMAHPTQRKSQS